MFQHLLREESIVIPFEATTRDAALAELVAMLPSWGLTPRQKSSLLELLIQREKFGTTATGDGVALPHATLPGISFPIVSLGISRRGIDSYPALDGHPVYIVGLVIFPENAAADTERYRLLHDAEMLFRDKFLCERLKMSESKEEAYEVILRQSSYLAEYHSAAAPR